MSADNQPPPKRTAFDWPADMGNVDVVLAEMETQVRQRKRARRIRMAGGALCLVASLGVFSTYLRVGSPERPSPAPVASTPAPRVPVSESSSSSAIVQAPARRVLPDSSVVLLREGTQITEAFTEGMRRIVLTEGAAHFTVVKDAGRPFIVEAAGTEIRAVGTAFTIDLTNQATVEVLVTEGRVAVAGNASLDTPSPEPLVAVDAGQRVEIRIGEPAGQAAPVVPVVDPRLYERLSWQVPRLEFRRTPVSEAVALINSYSRTQLLLEGSFSAVFLSGSLSADNIDALLDLLATDYGIEAELQDGGEILLRSRQSPKK